MRDTTSSVLALAAGCCCAIRHLELSFQSESLSARWGHRVVTILGFMPVLIVIMGVIKSVIIELGESHALMSADNSIMDSDPFLTKFRCAISLCPVRHPVREPSCPSVIYERAHIERWIEEHGTSPITRRPLNKSDLVPLRAIEAVIQYRLDQLEKIFNRTSK